MRTRDELDLTERAAVSEFFQSQRPEYVFLAAARVGGIYANSTLPVEFLRENILIQQNVIDAAFAAHVMKLLFLGSSCIYPKMAEQPIRESALLSGPLEPTNEAYAIAKIAGITLCRSFNREYGTRYISIMPTNLYGEGDNFDASHSHVLPALIRRFHEAKLEDAAEVVVWGTGTPRREFLHVDDLADASIHLMSTWGEPGPDGAVVGGDDAVNEIVNVGYGEDISIRELAEIIQEVVGFRGALRFDTTKPDGTPRKLLDSSRLRATGWRPRVSLADGIARTYRWFERNGASARVHEPLSAVRTGIGG